MPIEARFHVNPQGFPDLLAGQVTPEQFLRKLKRFWWRRIRAGEVAPVVARRIAFGRKVRGLHKVVDARPLRRRRRRVRARRRRPTSTSPAATSSSTCSGRSPPSEGKPGLIEMSCFTIAESPTLIRLFPEAKLIHTVRDGRDAGSSKVSKRQKRSHPATAPRESAGGRGASARSRPASASCRPGRLLTISLDELVDGDREDVYARDPRLPRASRTSRRCASSSTDEMSASAAHKERWREGLDDRRSRPTSSASTRRRSTGSSARTSTALRSCGGPTSTSPRERAAGAAPTGQPDAAEIVFVGGTGRSGTHALAQLLGRHSRLADVPIEARFHCNKRGMPDLLEGRITLPGYLAKLRGFWWHRVRVDGQPRGPLQPDAPVRVRRRPRALRGRPTPTTRSRACRELFLDLLWPVAERSGKPGLVEMSSHNVRAAQTLLRLFPEARFIHALRDGRDSAASVTGKTWGPRRVGAAIGWWADRLRAIEDGVRGNEDGAAYSIPADRFRVVLLEDLVGYERERTYADLLGFLGLDDEAADARVLRRPR